MLPRHAERINKARDFVSIVCFSADSPTSTEIHMKSLPQLVLVKHKNRLQGIFKACSKIVDIPLNDLSYRYKVEIHTNCL